MPPWITYARISGYRYRQITSVADPDDEFELYHEHVSFYGVPGASGWADRIGDVAIHYLGPHWAVFSKVFPFHEQTAACDAHEDVLLLGSTRHVMLTPHCAYRIGAAGLAHARCRPHSSRSRCRPTANQVRCCNSNRNSNVGLLAANPHRRFL